MHAFSRGIIALFASPIGIVVLAALDSTLFFSLPFGIDAAVIILAAHLNRMAWAVPLLATAGSVAGAALTFWMGEKVGEAGLSRYMTERRLQRIQDRVRRSGAIALAVLDLIPPPFPFTLFVLAAGALQVHARTFFVTLVVCRLVRFGSEALLATMYGKAILGWLESTVFHDVVLGSIVLAVVLTVLSMVWVIQATRAPRQGAAAP